MTITKYRNKRIYAANACLGRERKLLSTDKMEKIPADSRFIQDNNSFMILCIFLLRNRKSLKVQTLYNDRKGSAKETNIVYPRDSFFRLLRDAW